MEWKYINRQKNDEGETLTYDPVTGIYTYEPSGTYGQSDYTVRKRDDDTYDVYVESDSDKNHSHDHTDKNGDLLDNYHDYLASLLTNKEIEFTPFSDNQECINAVNNLLQNKAKIKTLFKK